MRRKNKAVKAFLAIQSEKDLKRAKLTLAEYRELGKDLQEFILTGQTRTIFKAVAVWLEKHGFIVEVEEVGWRAYKK